MFRKLSLIFVLWVISTVTAVAEPRIALVIGNSSYNAVSPLPNPTRDAALIGKTLEKLGFEVTLLSDANLFIFRQGVSDFGRKLRAAGPEATGLFYYAGHGVQSFGTNYLLPIDTALTDAADLDLVAVEAQTVLRQMFSARNKTNIVILDACRNNPFEDILDLDDNGLAEMKAPTGTFLAYATAPGAVALDGLDDNSPFTAALADVIQTPGEPIEQLFKKVRVEVLNQTRGQQTPWDTSSLTTDFVFAEAEVMSPEDLAELQLWNSVKDTRDPVQIMLFLRAYPASEYDDEARALLGEVMASEVNKSQPVTADPKPATEVANRPDAVERATFNAAQAIHTIAAYEEFLASYPKSAFAEIASSEIVALRSRTATDPTPNEPAQAEPKHVTFTTLLTVGSDVVIGKSIEQLAAGTPLYPPVEGLPESYWKDQQCSNCHVWTKDALCAQAKFYLGLNAQRSLAKEHPYGGSFKRNLKVWAAGDCQ